MQNSSGRKLATISGERRPKTLTDAMVSRPEYAELRVALVNPPQTYPIYLGNEYQSYVPLGLAILGAVLRRMGVQVKIIDCLATDYMVVHRPNVTFGMTAQQLEQELRAFAPQIVGVTNPFTCFIEDALRTARLIKQLDPTIQVILGGVEPSLEPGNLELLNNEPALDVLVRAEGEITLCDLIAHYDPSIRAFHNLGEVEGIVFRTPTGPCSTPKRPFISDLDELPLPAYDLLNLDQTYRNRFYARHRLRAKNARCLPIHTSRGCPYACVFCSVHSQVGKPNRRHSTAYVVRHMQHVMDTYGVRHFHFEDDNLTLHGPRAHELFEAITPLGVSWDTPNGLRADTITAELAQKMAAAGARSVTIAVESGDQEVLDTIVKKNLELADVRHAARHLQQAGIPTIAFFIVGFPGESQANVRTTLEFAKRLAIDYDTFNLLFVATPLPGTPLEVECREKGYLLQAMNNETLLSAIRLNQTPLIATDDFTKQDLFCWAKEVLDTPEIITIGEHMPFFFSSSARTRPSLRRLFGNPSLEHANLPPSYWRAPHNNPPSVLSQPVAA
ncbi:MAG TPA: radical SAM protein [Polyangiaceae bacterium]|nr:radical SAM protein [Polyangiaceae bacterium]